MPGDPVRAARSKLLPIRSAGFTMGGAAVTSQVLFVVASFTFPSPALFIIANSSPLIIV